MRLWCITLWTAWAAVSWSAEPAQPLESLTLDQALELAERLQPQLAEARALVEAAAGRAQQAGALPNPELVAGALQLPLDSGAANQREYVAGVGQTIPLSGRLGKTRAAELLETEVRKRGLEAMRRDLHKRVHSAFATALYQEQAFLTTRQGARDIARLVAATRARVEAGDAVAEEQARVEIELVRADVETRRSQSLREQALLGLAAAIGDPQLSISSLAGKLDEAFEVPTLEVMAAALSAHPQIALTDASLQASEARVALAKAERIPDVKLEVLYHRLEGPRENTLDLGLTVPLPLFNRGQGRLREARAEVAAAEARSRVARNELTVRLREAHSRWTTALAHARSFKTEILPRAETILKSAEARYAAGDLNLVGILPVRRDRAVLQMSYLESLRDVMQAWAAVREFVLADGSR